MADRLTLFDLSDWTQIVISGTDRKTFLHNFCTNDIQQLTPGDVCEAFVPDIKGRVLGHVLVVAEDEKLHLLSVPGGRETLLPHLQKYLLGVEAEITDCSTKEGLICLVGNDASEALGFPSDFGMDHAERLAWEGPPLMSARVDLTNAPTYLVYGEQDQTKMLVEQLLSRDVEEGTLATFERLRIEAGFPFVGKDIGETNIAQEAARDDRAISFTKGCYLGQEPIARLDAMGHTNKELRGLFIQSDSVSAGAAIRVGDQDVGKVSSIAAREDGSSVALGMIRTKYTKPGTVELQVTTDSGTAPARLFWPRYEEE